MDAKSIEKYELEMRWFDDFLDNNGYESVLDLEYEDDAVLLFKTLRSDFSRSTARFRWDMINRFYNYLVERRKYDIEYNPLTTVDADKADSGLSKEPQQESELGDDEQYALTQDEVRMIEENVGEPKIRNYLLVRLMWQTGMRRGEASHIKLEHIDTKKREIKIPSENAKNGKSRTVSYQPSLDTLLKTWLGGNREQYLGDTESSYLFVGVRGGPRLRGEAINEVVRKAADRAGINRVLYYENEGVCDEHTKHQLECEACCAQSTGARWKITSHSLRHGFGMYAVHETPAKLYHVSQMMGHSSTDITEKRYLKNKDEKTQELMKKFGPS